VIGPHVRIGAGTSIGAHCVIEGHTTIGRDNRIFQFASRSARAAGHEVPRRAHRWQIGDRNTIREFCTFNTRHGAGRGVTRIGDDNWIMAYVHVAHDVQAGQPHHPGQQRHAGRPRARGRLGHPSAG
jgi:UDP-N-acetylglucosamine acyltransferase